MTDIRFVYFDLDDTLLDHRSAERLALGRLHDRYPDLKAVPLRTFLDKYHEVNVRVWREYGAGALDKEQAKAGRFQRLYDELGVRGPDPAAMGDEYLVAYADFWRFIPGAADAYETIARSKPAGLLTNGFAEIQRSKLVQFPLLEELAQAIVISEEVGMMKPDPRLFAHAVAAAGVPADNILYIGDSLHSDVEGGLRAGWQVAWFHGRPETAPAGVFCFDDWSILVDRLA